MKKIYSLLILALLGIGSAWAYDFSAVAPSGQTLYYTINGSNAEVTYQNSSSPRYSNLYGALEIPSSVTYNGQTYSVTSIGDYAFRDCSGLTSVTIPNSVTSIGGVAFYYCSGLTSVTIPNSVTSIGEWAFGYCSGLTSVTIPNSVTSIGDCAFHYCRGLTSVTIGNSVTSIGDMAFYYCSGLTSVTIPNSVTSIGTGAFCNCSGLSTLIVDANNATYDSRDNCNAIIETSSNTLIVGCNNSTIPNSVTYIGNYAFFGCSGLTSVTIPNSVTSIGAYAFGYCSGLTSVTIPNSVTSIGDLAFAYCSGLQEITSLSQTAPALGYEVFDSVSSNIPVNIPCGSLNSYSSRWSYFSNFVEFGPDGIADAEQAAYTIRTTADRIVVEGAENETVRLFDCAGRCLQTVLAAEGCTLEVPAAGVYLLQIGNNAAQKVVVLK